MQATCLKCGNRAEVSLTADGFRYSLGSRAMLCPVVQRRAEKEGGRKSDLNCDHMAMVAQEVAHRIRGGR
jgi:hypothetical protein